MARTRRDRGAEVIDLQRARVMKELGLRWNHPVWKGETREETDNDLCPDCDGSGQCAECEGMGCSECDDEGHCPACEGRGKRTDV